MKEKRCRKCGILLNTNNWYRIHVKQSIYICNKCYYIYNKKFELRSYAKRKGLHNFALFQDMIIKQDEFINPYPETQKWLSSLTPERRGIYCRVLTNPEFNES